MSKSRNGDTLVELPTKVNFWGKLTNERTRNKVTQSKEFQDFDKFSLQDCFRAALEQEGIGMVSEAVDMTATTIPKIMAIHDEKKKLNMYISNR